jgi:GWxTD domain-containing protein
MSHTGELRVLVALGALLVLSTFGSSQEQSIGANLKNPTDVRGLKHDGGIPPLKPWLEEDVAWIISDEERAAFKLLKNDEQRDQFIVAFWERRDPTPDTFENEYKIEHYQRFAYANDHFNARIPGWKTDRGRIYILQGPPDKIESYPAGRTQDKSTESKDALPYPLETWSYRYIQGVGIDIVINFVDPCGCGDYQMKMPPEMRDALFAPPPSGLIGNAQAHIESGGARVFLQPVTGPLIRFKDLEALLNSQPPPTSIPFDVKVDFEKVTSVTSLVPMTIAVRNQDVTFIDESGVRRGRLNVFGRITTLTGHVVDVFEGSIVITAPRDSAPSARDEVTYLKKTFALQRGRYRLQIVVKDANGDQAGAWSRSVVVAGL